jgi:hypothetical protein
MSGRRALIQRNEKSAAMSREKIAVVYLTPFRTSSVFTTPESKEEIVKTIEKKEVPRIARYSRYRTL